MFRWEKLCLIKLKMVIRCSLCRAEKSSINSHLAFHRYGIIYQILFTSHAYLTSQAYLFYVILFVFSLPQDPHVRKQWLQILKKDNGVFLYVCSQHFEPDDYRKFCDRPLLKKNAVPHINLFKFETDLHSPENNSL